MAVRKHCKLPHNTAPTKKEKSVSKRRGFVASAVQTHEFKRIPLEVCISHSKVLQLRILRKFVLKIISYNLNGIRAAMRKDWLGWLQSTNPDIVCLQEIKATPDQFDIALFQHLNYHCYWFPAQKKGYSGVAILAKQKADFVQYGSNMPQSDEEGRVLRADFGELSVVSAYFPSGTTEVRQEFKLLWLEQFYSYVAELITERPNLIIAGDYNICHKAPDIHNPMANQNTPGFLPVERHWMDNFLALGFEDSFRLFNAEPHNYTWWSYRVNARERNLGWRIDYQMVTKPLVEKLNRAAILSKARHSDHCPTLIELRT